MWFLFGFTTLISFTVYFGIAQFRFKWKGQHASDGVLAYEYLFNEVDKRTRSFEVGVSAPPEFDFVLRREMPIDRIFKYLGLSVEHQVGSDSFDRLVYIVSNDVAFLKNVLSDQIAIDAVVKLFMGLKYECAVSEIRCVNGRLWASVNVGKRFGDPASRVSLEKVVPYIALHLASISQLLGINRPGSKGTSRDRFILRAACILAMSTGLLVNGAVHSLRIFWGTREFTVDSAQLQLWSVCGGVVVVGFLVVAAVLLLGRSSRTHLVVIEILITGFVGSTLTIFSELRDVNMEWDKSKVELAATKIVTKKTSSSRKGGRHCFLGVQDWRGRSDSVEIRVACDFFARAAVGGGIDMHQRSGYLGVPWVESFELLSN